MLIISDLMILLLNCIYVYMCIYTYIHRTGGYDKIIELILLDFIQLIEKNERA